jgi:NADPH-dependent curcumin reductase CurA
VPQIADGQVLVRNHFLSLDPYMRGRMNDAKSYAAPVNLGDVMVGGTAGEVVASKNPKFAVGDKVVGYLGWQLYGVSDGAMLMKVDDRHIPLSAYLGSVGMPGVTAWYGLMDICAPKAGETVVVTAASGAVGSVVGQLAKMKGCRAVGIAGGAEKCRYVVDELGFDACVDYKAGNLWKDIKAATPNGIDCLFENVGGEIFDTLLGRMNAFSRIAVCGLISQYNSEPHAMKNIGSVLINRIKMQGFIVSEHMERWPVALSRAGAGRRHRQDQVP